MTPRSDLNITDQKDKMAAALKKAGVRVTRQRIALLTVLGEATDHPDAYELHRRAQILQPSVSLATVYRTLAVLEAEGVVHRNNFEGSGARYETAHQEHHDHIVDLDSGEVIEFVSDEIEALQAEIAARMGYKVLHHRLELYCQKVKD